MARRGSNDYRERPGGFIAVVGGAGERGERGSVSSCLVRLPGGLLVGVELAVEVAATDRFVDFVGIGVAVAFVCAG